jgi:hypothetical protein
MLMIDDTQKKMMTRKYLRAQAESMFIGQEDGFGL